MAHCGAPDWASRKEGRGGQQADWEVKGRAEEIWCDLVTIVFLQLPSAASQKEEAGEELPEQRTPYPPDPCPLENAG